ncbi:MAG: serine/threonine-protein kinase [Pseudomonadota bacterium]
MEPTAAELECGKTSGMPLGEELLNGQFLVRAQLQSGGFALTYIARDSLARQVVVKECFPSALCTREKGIVLPVSAAAEAQFDAIKTQFVREARQLAKLVHPNIVAVHQVFDENNTAYMALDHIKGCDLITLAEEQPERITNDFLLKALNQCLIAIGFIHERSLLHRDISPDNMMVDENDHLTLIDFGAAHEKSNTDASPLFAVKDGYSPYELYVRKGRHDFSTDLYALGATFYYLITGTTPPDALTRLTALTAGQKDPYAPLSAGAWPFDPKILGTIDRALKMRQANRFHSVKDWVNGFHEMNRKAQVPAPKSQFDPNLENEIARIVEHTNTQLQNVHGTASAKSQKQKERHTAPERPRQNMVDIFGQPIEDIAAWQDEQEREIEDRSNARRAAAQQGRKKDADTQNSKPLMPGIVERYLPQLSKMARRSRGAA